MGRGERGVVVVGGCECSKSVGTVAVGVLVGRALMGYLTFQSMECLHSLVALYCSNHTLSIL